MDAISISILILMILILGFGIGLMIYANYKDMKKEQSTNEKKQIKEFSEKTENYCKICGVPSDTKDLCLKCQERIKKIEYDTKNFKQVPHDYSNYKKTEQEQTDNNQHTLGQCKICGLPSDVYEICRQCQMRVNNGEIIKCPQCGNYHAKGYTCICQQTKKTKQEREETSSPNSNTYININQEPEEQGCFSKAFGGTMGAGCGCVTFIIIAFIIAVLAISGGMEAIFS